MRKILITILFFYAVNLSGQVMFPGVVASSIQTAVAYSFSDDFQSRTTGDLHNQGLWLDGYASDPSMSVVDVSGDKRITGGNSSAECMAYYNDENIGNDYYVEIEIDALSSGSNYIGVAARCSQTMNYYALYVNNGNVYFFVSEDWVYSDIINTQSVTISVGDKIALSVDGSTITCYKNGSVWTELGSAISPATGNNGVYTDTRLLSGKPGVSAYGNLGESGGDNFYFEEL